MPYADSEGVKIKYEKAGKGEPLLLVMGYGLPGAAWAVTLPYFTDRFEVVYFDNRGTGASDAPEEGYEIEDFARDARAVLDAAGWSSAHVFGVSMGGMIAQQLALDAPERVRSLVLGCTSSGVPEERAPEHEEALRTLGEAIALMQEDPERSVQLMLPLSYPESFIDAHPEMAPLMAMMMRAMPTKKAPEVRLDAGAQLWQSAPRLAELSMPALVLHGTEDRLVPLEHGMRLFEGLPQAEIRIFKGAGHAFQAQDMDGITRGIAGWLAVKSSATATIVPVPAT